MMMLKPYPADDMEAYPVSTRVGSVKNTDAALFEPLAGNTAPI
jgi:putative SOS response-associated peptidase YedK